MNLENVKTWTQNSQVAPPFKSLEPTQEIQKNADKPLEIRCKRHLHLTHGEKC